MKSVLNFKALLAFILCFTAILTLAGCGAVNFDVDFVVDGQTVHTVSTSGNEVIELPPNPEKDGYEFKGWYWDNEAWLHPFTVNSLLDTPVTGDMKVYAKFEKIGSTAIDTEPQPGTAYLLFVDQANAGVRCYLNGANDGYYLSTSVEIDGAVNVYVEESDMAGKFNMFCVKNGERKYINVVKADDRYSLTYHNAPITAYDYDIINKRISTTLDGIKLNLGANGTNTYKRIEPRAQGEQTFYASLCISPSPDAAIPDASAKSASISEIVTGSLGLYKTEGTVVAVNAQSFLIKDESGAILVYKGSGWTVDVNVGDKLSVEGKTVVYSLGKQFTTDSKYTKTGTGTVEHSDPSVLDASKINAYASQSSVSAHYVKVQGTLAISGPYSNLVVDGADVICSITYPIESLAAQNGKALDVLAYVTGVTSAGTQKYLNLIAVSVKEAESVPNPNPNPTPNATETDVAGALMFDGEGAVKVSGVIVAINEKGFVLADQTGAMTVFLNSAHEYKVGDAVTLVGELGAYSGVRQFTQSALITKTGEKTVVYPSPTELDGAALDAYIGTSVVPSYVKVVGTLTVSGNYYNLAVEGAETAIGSLVYPNASVASLDGKTVEVLGYLVYVNSSKYVNVVVTSINEVNSNPAPDPTPSVTETDIAGAHAFDGEGAVKVSGVVIAWNAQSFLIEDESGIIMVYRGSSWTRDVEVCDKISIVGTVSTYAKSKQFAQDAVYEKIGSGDVSLPNPAKLDAEDIDAYAAAESVKPAYVTVSGVLTVSGNYYNISFEGTTVIGSISYPPIDISSFNGKEITVIGHVTGVSGTSQKYLNILAHYISETEAEPTVPELDVAGAHAFDGEGAVKVSGVIMAKNEKGFVLADETGAITVFLNAAHEYAIGDAVTVEGELGEHGGVRQFTQSALITKTGEETVVYPSPAELDGAALDAYLSTSIIPSYVKLVGTLTVSGNYYNLTVEGAETAVGSLVYPPASLAELNGKKIEVLGYLVYVSGTKYVNIVASSVSELSSEPAPEPEPEYDVISLSDFIEKAEDNDGNYYYIEAVIAKIVQSTYGNSYLVDENGTVLYNYGIYDENGTKYGDITGEKPAVGDKVLLYAQASYYNGPQAKNSKIISFTSELSGKEKLAVSAYMLEIQTSFVESGMLTLPTTGTLFTNVSVSWTVNGEAMSGEYSVETASESQILNVVATLTLDADTVQKTFTVEVAAESTLEPVLVDEPEFNTGYKLALNQATIGKFLYFNGEISSAGFLMTTEDLTLAVDVFMEEADEAAGTYRLYFMKEDVKTYVEMYAYSQTSARYTLTSEPTMTYSYNTEYGAHTATVNGNVFYIGIYGTYDTFSCSGIGYIANDGNFTAKFYALE